MRACADAPHTTSLMPNPCLAGAWTKTMSQSQRSGLPARYLPPRQDALCLVGYVRRMPSAFSVRPRLLTHFPRGVDCEPEHATGAKRDARVSVLPLSALRVTSAPVPSTTSRRFSRVGHNGETRGSSGITSGTSILCVFYCDSPRRTRHQSHGPRTYSVDERIDERCGSFCHACMIGDCPLRGFLSAPFGIMVRDIGEEDGACPR